MITWLRYVPYEYVAAFEAKGWIAVAHLGFPHAHHAVLMQWTRDGEPA